MYHIAVYFDVPAKRRQEFIDAALENSQQSVHDEDGTKCLELIEARENGNRFYLNEAYDDEAAFKAHTCGPHFARSFGIIEEFAIEGPRLIDGTQIEARVTPRPAQE